MAAVALAAQAPAAAQQPAAGVPVLDARIATVRTGGYWEAGGQRGYYRAVELQDGWEEIRRRVLIQWLAVPAERGEATVVATVALQGPPEIWALSDPELALHETKWRVTVRTAAAPFEQPSGSLDYELGAPGEVHAIRTP